MKVIESKKRPGYFIIPVCPGCGSIHYLNVNSPDDKPKWDFFGSLEEPSFYPSLLSYTPNDIYRCHSFITQGKMRFLDDCSHTNKNALLDMPEIDETSSFYEYWQLGEY